MISFSDFILSLDESLNRQMVRDILRVRPKMSLADIKRLTKTNPSTLKRAADEGSWIREYLNKTMRKK